MLIVFFVLILIVFYKRLIQKRLDEKNRERLSKLIKQGNAIKIDLSTITIKHRTWKNEIMVDMQGNEIDPDYRRTNRYYEFRKIRKYKSELKISVAYNGQNISFLTTLNVDGNWLGIKFHLQKWTYLYIDKNDLENSYIDFTFLDKHKIGFNAVHTINFYKNDN